MPSRTNESRPSRLVRATVANLLAYLLLAALLTALSASLWFWIGLEGAAKVAGVTNGYLVLVATRAFTVGE